MQILPARDVSGAHGKTYLFTGFDQIHAYRDYGLIEALAPDPTRLDALAWITGYSGIRHSPGITLHDLMPAGRRSDDARMSFSWYGANFATYPAAYVEGPPGLSTAKSTPLPRTSELGILTVYRPNSLTFSP